MKRPTVLLADDHALVLEGLRKILEPDFDVVGVVEDGRALVRIAPQLKPDIILADITMPLLNGVEAARQIMKSDPNAKIIMLTMHPDPTYATEALEAGCLGYVLKHSAAAELVTAIQEVLKGRIYVTPRIAGEVADALRQGLLQRQKSVAHLTPRQREVLQLVAEGKSLKEIADILHVSKRTAEFHKYRIKDELGLRTNADFTQYAIKHGIISA
jgi:DNA-binding NarL/FixJ family response regulator